MGWVTSSPPSSALQGLYQLGPWTVDTYEEPCHPGDIGLDTYLVAVFDDVLRIAVFDGAQDLLVPDSHAHAARAVHTTRGWLRSLSSVPDALLRASTVLVDQELRPRTKNPLCTVAIADIAADGSAKFWRCGDSEVWACIDGAWQGVLAGDMLTSPARARWDVWCAAHPDATEPEAWAAQETLLDEPDDFIAPPMGLVSVPIPQTSSCAQFDEIIVATDGLILNPDRCAHLDTWAHKDIQLLPLVEPYTSPHADLAYVGVRRR